MSIAQELVRNQRSRNRDAHGSGQFGESRGNRKHKGLDVVANVGEMIFSPIEGTIVREAFPYKDDPSVRGVVIQGTGTWEGYEVKVFYAQGLVCGAVLPGQHIAFAQDLTKKYLGITNHIHVEVRLKGKVIAPQELFVQCF
ncbi:MAG TPA: hypothetical protein VMR43_14820 [Variovorax sp.]|nr:hypothetical protein [Variovorax sp.]